MLTDTRYIATMACKSMINKEWTMKTEKAIRQFEVAQEIALGLHDIQIINPKCLDVGANKLREAEGEFNNNDTYEQDEWYFVPPYSSRERPFMALRLRERHGGRLNEMRENCYFLSKHDWLKRGERTLVDRHGNSKDCAAAAAFLLLSTLPNDLINIKIELVTCRDRTFVIINREGGIHDVNTWGENAFFMDIWYQNHYPLGLMPGVYWANNEFHFYCEKPIAPVYAIDIMLRDRIDF